MHVSVRVHAYAAMCVFVHPLTSTMCVRVCICISSAVTIAHLGSVLMADYLLLAFKQWLEVHLPSCLDTQHIKLDE